MPFLIDGCQSVQSYSDFKELSKQLAMEPTLIVSNHRPSSRSQHKPPPGSPEPRHSAKESLERDKERKQREAFDILDRLCKHRRVSAATLPHSTTVVIPKPSCPTWLLDSASLRPSARAATSEAPTGVLGTRHRWQTIYISKWRHRSAPYDTTAHSSKQRLAVVSQPSTSTPLTSECHPFPWH